MGGQTPAHACRGGDDGIRQAQMARLAGLGRAGIAARNGQALAAQIDVAPAQTEQPAFA